MSDNDKRNISLRITMSEDSFEEIDKYEGLLSIIAQILDIRTENISIIESDEVQRGGSFCTIGIFC